MQLPMVCVFRATIALRFLILSHQGFLITTIIVAGPVYKAILREACFALFAIRQFVGSDNTGPRAARSPMGFVWHAQ